MQTPTLPTPEKAQEHFGLLSRSIFNMLEVEAYLSIALHAIVDGKGDIPATQEMLYQRQRAWLDTDYSNVFPCPEQKDVWSHSVAQEHLISKLEHVHALLSGVSQVALTAGTSEEFSNNLGFHLMTIPDFEPQIITPNPSQIAEQRISHFERGEYLDILADTTFNKAKGLVSSLIDAENYSDFSAGVKKIETPENPVQPETISFDDVPSKDQQEKHFDKLGKTQATVLNLAILSLVLARSFYRTSVGEGPFSFVFKQELFHSNLHSHFKTRS